jgi:signal transduction histidine kinase
MSPGSATTCVTIHDDGVGGVDPRAASAARARINAVDGTGTVSSPPGGPTTVVVQIPRKRRATP